MSVHTLHASLVHPLQVRPQLVRGVEAAGADGTVSDTCPSWPTLLAWIEGDLGDEETRSNTAGCPSMPPAGMTSQ